MATNSLSILLSGQAKAYVEATIEDGAFKTPEAYIDELIKADHERRLFALEARLLKALQGDGITLTAEEVEGGGVMELLRKKRGERQDRAA